MAIRALEHLTTFERAKIGRNEEKLFGVAGEMK